MKSIAITGTRRAADSKQETKRLRAEGKVPCVLYGGKEQLHFSAPALTFRNLVYSPEVFLVDLNIDGTSHRAVMREVQFHPVTDRLNHIDFLEITEDKKVTMEIPVKLKGAAIGVREGGQLLFKMRKLKISALPKALPEHVEIVIDEMAIGDTVRVRDMKMDGVEFLDIPAASIVAVKTARAVVEETPAAVATTAGAEGAAPAEGAAAAPGAAAPAAGAPAAAPAKEEKKK
jgi:large subunit ribosomal protein L25